MASDRAVGQLVREHVAGRLDVRLADIPALVKLAELLEGEAPDHVSLQDAQSAYTALLRVTRATLVVALEITVSEVERAAVLTHFDNALPPAVREAVEVGRIVERENDRP